MQGVTIAQAPDATGQDWRVAEQSRHVEQRDSIGMARASYKRGPMGSLGLMAHG